jgi:hypothetical protein
VRFSITHVLAVVLFLRIAQTFAFVHGPTRSLQTGLPVVPGLARSTIQHAHQKGVIHRNVSDRLLALLPTFSLWYDLTDVVP